MSFKPSDWDDDRLIDLLVDGELSEQRRGELLLACEQRPELWRKCSLAFLEAQTWRGATIALPASPVDRPAVAAPPARRRRLSRETWSLALAAALLVGASLGMWGERRFGAAPGGPAAPGPDVPQVAAPAEPPLIEEMQTPTAEVALVRLPGERQGASRRVALPVIRGDVDAWLASQASVVTEDLRAVMRQSGYEVRSQPSFQRVRLPDGRQALLPYEEVQVQYTPELAYQ